MLKSDIATACRMKSSGKSIAQIAQHFSVGEGTIEYWVYPNERERLKRKARERMRRVRERWTSEQKAANNASTVETLMRKKKIQPEYKEYSDETHYRYVGTPKANRTRRKYYEKNSERLNEYQRKQYRKHREKRLASSKIYVAQHLEEIRKKMRDYYWNNRGRILAKHKERRASN